MELAYDRIGAGSPLVLLHGVGHRRQAWAPVLSRLTPHREVVTVDFPGFGQSPPLPAHLPYEMDSLITVMRQFFERLGLDRPHVAGNSMGGLVSLVLAQQGLARSVTALAPAGLWTPAQRRRALALVRAVHRTACRISPALATRLARSVTGRKLLAGMIVARPALLDPQVLLADIRAMAEAVALVPTLAAGRQIIYAGTMPDVPVTIAWGTRDRILQRPRAELITRLIPQARLLILPGCGHVPMTDDPALVADILLTGSREQEPAPRPQESTANPTDPMASLG